MPEPTVDDRLQLCADQLRLSVEHHGEKYGVIIMKKHYGQYLKGVRNGKKLRGSIMPEKEMQPILEKLLNFKEEELYAVA